MRCRKHENEAVETPAGTAYERERGRVCVCVMGQWHANDTIYGVHGHVACVFLIRLIVPRIISVDV